MSSSLLIVESPSKAKTLKKYLGKDFEILASYGHVRDLVPKQGAVDTEHDFKMKYQLIERNSKHVDAIAKAVKLADNIYLATDPDREGEAMHNPEALAAFAEALREHIRAPAELVEIDAHINDEAFVEKALEIFDGWVEQGLVPRGHA